MVIEGQEKEDFWDLLGGKAPYSSDPRLVEDNEDHPPRLFQCSNASGVFTVNEIVEFVQVGKRLFLFFFVSFKPHSFYSKIWSLMMFSSWMHTTVCLYGLVKTLVLRKKPWQKIQHWYEAHLLLNWMSYDSILNEGIY
jgi:hypothetical protein